VHRGRLRRVDVAPIPLPMEPGIPRPVLHLGVSNNGNVVLTCKRAVAVVIACTEDRQDLSNVFTSVPLCGATSPFSICHLTARYRRVRRSSAWSDIAHGPGRLPGMTPLEDAVLEQGKAGVEGRAFPRRRSSRSPRRRTAYTRAGRSPERRPSTRGADPCIERNVSSGMETTTCSDEYPWRRNVGARRDCSPCRRPPVAIHARVPAPWRQDRGAPAW